MTRRRLAVLALATTTLVATACGGGSKSSSSQRTSSTLSSPAQPEPPAHTAKLTQTQLIAKADALCGRIMARRDVIKVKTPVELQLAVPQIVAYQRTLLAGLSALGAPVSLASDWKAIVADVRTMTDSVTKINEYARTNKLAAGRPLFAVFAQSRLQLHATAGRDGFKACARF